MSRLFEKIEIPEIDLSETEKAIKNIWAEIDRIAKDIQEQKDNAMAMEFTKCIGELLRKNGVLPKMTEYTRDFETDNTFETRYGVSIDELDFSEHDKVFENEIAGLKAKNAIKDMDYKTVSELLGKYQQENESLKQRIIELENFSCQAEQEAESLVEKLNQHIAELESKKRKRPCFVSYVGVEEINGKEYVSMEKFATAMEELNAYFDKFFDS